MKFFRILTLNTYGLEVTLKLTHETGNSKEYLSINQEDVLVVKDVLVPKEIALEFLCRPLYYPDEFAEYTFFVDLFKKEESLSHIGQMLDEIRNAASLGLRPAAKQFKSSATLGDSLMYTILGNCLNRSLPPEISKYGSFQANRVSDPVALPPDIRCVHQAGKTYTLIQFVIHPDFWSSIPLDAIPTQCAEIAKILKEHLKLTNLAITYGGQQFNFTQFDVLHLYIKSIKRHHLYRDNPIIRQIIDREISRFFPIETLTPDCQTEFLMHVSTELERFPKGLVGCCLIPYIGNETPPDLSAGFIDEDDLLADVPCKYRGYATIEDLGPSCQITYLMDASKTLKAFPRGIIGSCLTPYLRSGSIESEELPPSVRLKSGI